MLRNSPRRHRHLRHLEDHGTGLRQLASARGMTADPEGTIHVELPARSRTCPRQAV